MIEEKAQIIQKYPINLCPKLTISLYIKKWMIVFM
jgi:hypothetical protein